MQASHINPQTQSGFTLVEALVSVLVLSASLVAITSLLTRAIQATIISQDYLIASKLAQEGLEMVRVKRNNNLIARAAAADPATAASINWNDDLYDASGTGGTWEMEAAEAGTVLAHGGTFTSADPANRASWRVFRIYTSGVNAGKYTYSNAGTTRLVPGNFKRIVTITRITDYSAAVTATVAWGSTDSFTLSTVIYNAS